MFLLRKGNFIIITEFRYGQTWKIGPSPLSLSLYSTFKLGWFSLTYSYVSSLVLWKSYILMFFWKKLFNSGVAKWKNLHWKNLGKTYSYKPLLKSMCRMTFIIITNRISIYYYKTGKNYYKPGQLFQNRGNYYKSVHNSQLVGWNRVPQGIQFLRKVFLYYYTYLLINEYRIHK